MHINLLLFVNKFKPNHLLLFSNSELNSRLNFIIQQIIKFIPNNVPNNQTKFVDIIGYEIKH